MSYANDFNSYMLDDYGLPSYSRRSSYNFAFGDQLPQPSNASSYPGDRKMSTASALSDRSTVTKSLELPQLKFGRQNSTASLVSTENGLMLRTQKPTLITKKVRNGIAAVVLLLGCVIFIVGVCLLVFSGDAHYKGQTAFAPLGYFFLALGILVVLLTLSIVFLPSNATPFNSKFVTVPVQLPPYMMQPMMSTLNAAQLPQTISSLGMERQSSTEEPTPSTPKITITPETNIGKFPMSRMNAIEDGANKYGESSKGTTAF